MTQDVKQLRVKIFDELSQIVDPEINTTITELELIDAINLKKAALDAEKKALQDKAVLETQAQQKLMRGKMANEADVQTRKMNLAIDQMKTSQEKTENK